MLSMTDATVLGRIAAALSRAEAAATRLKAERAAAGRRSDACAAAGERAVAALDTLLAAH